MATRSREHRKAIPGYDEFRPTRDERQRDHRRARHAANQVLHVVDDPDELDPLPEVKRDRPGFRAGSNGVQGRRFKVWKTKFWKRRESFQDMKAALDARWTEVLDAEEEEEDW
jgi:hypothetical protein